MNVAIQYYIQKLSMLGFGSSSRSEDGLLELDPGLASGMAVSLSNIRKFYGSDFGCVLMLVDLALSRLTYQSRLSSLNQAKLLLPLA
jgi:hypothetical protein